MIHKRNYKRNCKKSFDSLRVLLAVPVWSGVNIAGVRLRDLNPMVGTSEDPEKYNEMHKDVVNRYCTVYLSVFTYIGV